MAAWSPDGKQIAFTAGEERPNVYVADAEGENVRQLNPGETGAVFPFWSPDGKKIGYTVVKREGMSTELVWSNADGTGQETILQSDKIAFVGPGGVSTDGKRLLYTRVDPEAGTVGYHLYDAASKADSAYVDSIKVGEEHRIAQFMTASWDADGKSILCTLVTDKGTGLFRVSEDGKTKTRLTPEGVDSLHPAAYAGK